MGFFSWECQGCGLSLLPVMQIEMQPPLPAWLAEGIALGKDAQVRGRYNGYGVLGGLPVPKEPAVWHLLCWEKAGCPTTHTPSEYSDDQGWFIEYKRYARAVPRAAPRAKRRR